MLSMTALGQTHSSAALLFCLAFPVWAAAASTDFRNRWTRNLHRLLSHAHIDSSSQWWGITCIVETGICPRVLRSSTASSSLLFLPTRLFPPQLQCPLPHPTAEHPLGSLPQVLPELHNTLVSNTTLVLLRRGFAAVALDRRRRLVVIHRLAFVVLRRLAIVFIVILPGLAVFLAVFLGVVPG